MHVRGVVYGNSKAILKDGPNGILRIDAPQILLGDKDAAKFDDVELPVRMRAARLSYDVYAGHGNS